jgi:segregation and condensation protein A
LELFREAAIAFEQAEALGELTVRWTGTDAGDIEVSDEFDEGDPGEGDGEGDHDEGDGEGDQDEGDQDEADEEEPHDE